MQRAVQFQLIERTDNKERLHVSFKKFTFFAFSFLPHAINQSLIILFNSVGGGSVQVVNERIIIVQAHVFLCVRVSQFKGPFAFAVPGKWLPSIAQLFFK